MVSLQRGLDADGRRCARPRALARLNQRHGFDCPGCAWPEEHGGRKLAEFCENGAKAVAEEATKRARHRRSSSPRTRSPSWRAQPDYWLGQQGRLTQPMVLRAGRRPLPADRLGRRLRLIADAPARARPPRRGGVLHLGPHQQRGRVPVPAVRPQLRHQQPAGLLEHVPRVVAAPRWSSRSASARARSRSTTSTTPTCIVDRRPEPRHQPSADALGAGEGEGQRREDHRGQPAARGRPDRGSRTRRRCTACVGARHRRSPTSSCRSGSAATWRCSPASGRLLLEAEDAAPGTVLDRAFIDAHSAGLRRLRARSPRRRPATTVVEATGIDRDAAASASPRCCADSQRTIVLLGDGPHPAPARGGDHPRDRQPAAAARHHRQARRRACARCAGTPTCRATARWASGRRCPRRSSPRSTTRFGIASPREHGYDTVDAIRAMRDGEAKVFVGMGGNFVSRDPRHRRHRGGAARLRADRAGLDQAQPQPPRHGAHGADPADAGPHRPRHPGRRQTAGHRRGLDVDGAPVARQPAPAERRSCAARSRSSASWPARVLGADHPVPWETFDDDYDRIRDAIAARGARLRRLQPPGARSPTASSCRTRRATRANSPPPPARPTSRVEPARMGAGAAGPAGAADAAQPRPVQHHHLRPRRPLPRHQGRAPRGVRQPRRHRRARPVRRRPRRPGLGVHRRRRRSCRSVAPRTSWSWPYSTPVGNAAAYYPETNPLVPLDHTAARSNTPVSKAIVDPTGDRVPGRAKRRGHRSGPGDRTPRASHVTADDAVTRARDRWSSRSRWRSGVNGTPLTVTMRTPGSDVELAQGFLLTEGVIARPRRRRSTRAVLPQGAGRRQTG